MGAPDASNPSGAASGPPSSIHITHRTDRSATTYVLQKLLRPFRDRILSSKPTHGGSMQLDVPKVVGSICNINEHKVAGTYIYDVVPKSFAADRKTRRRIYYFAGGSWQMPPSKQHWRFLLRLSQKLPTTTVSLVSQPLAPHSPAPKAFPQLLETYVELMRLSAEAGEEVVFAGDSSGGNIVLALPLEAMRLYPDLPTPAAIIAICPSTDLTRENPAIEELDDIDPILGASTVRQSAAAWSGDWDRKDPRLSPRWADLSPLVKNNIQVHGVTAGMDVLSPDAVIFRDLLQKAGVKGEWLQWDTQFHCFPMTWMYGLREGKESFRWIASLLERDSLRA